MMSVNEYILRQCAQQIKESDLVIKVAKKFNLTSGITERYIRKLKNDGLLCVLEKNTLKAI